MIDEPIPGVDPIEAGVDMPGEWIVVKCPAKWNRITSRDAQCDDCLRVILEWVRGNRGHLTHPPGPARRVEWRRLQHHTITLHCDAHHDLRVAREDQ